jgi:hypothetical protein
VLVHGDVLHTEGNTRVATLVGRVTRSPWSHVAMYIGPLETGPIVPDHSYGTRRPPAGNRKTL